MNFKEPNPLAIALGANLPSQIGPPISTLIAVRPIIEEIVSEWLLELDHQKTGIDLHSTDLRWRWSPLYETAPIGGPSKQNPYITHA